MPRTSGSWRDTKTGPTSESLRKHQKEEEEKLKLDRVRLTETPEQIARGEKNPQFIPSDIEAGLTTGKSPRLFHEELINRTIEQINASAKVLAATPPTNVDLVNAIEGKSEVPRGEGGAVLPLLPEEAKTANITPTTQTEQPATPIQQQSGLLNAPSGIIKSIIQNVNPEQAIGGTLDILASNEKIKSMLGSAARVAIVGRGVLPSVIGDIASTPKRVREINTAIGVSIKDLNTNFGLAQTDTDFSELRNQIEDTQRLINELQSNQKGLGLANLDYWATEGRIYEEMLENANRDLNRVLGKLEQKELRASLGVA